MTAVKTRNFSLSVSSWGGHKLFAGLVPSSSFLRSSICRACSVNLFSSVFTTMLPSRSKMRNHSTLSALVTAIRLLPFVGGPLTSFTWGINRRSYPAVASAESSTVMVLRPHEFSMFSVPRIPCTLPLSPTLTVALLPTSRRRC